MDGIEIKIINKQALSDMVGTLESIDKDKAIRSGLRSGGMLLKSAGIRRLRRVMKKSKGVSGNLLRSFEVHVKRNSLGVLVGFHQGDKGDPKNGYHAMWVDLGTNDRTTKSGHHTGAARALRFWSDTRNEDMVSAQGKVIQGIEKYVDKIHKQ